MWLWAFCRMVISENPVPASGKTTPSTTAVNSVKRTETMNALRIMEDSSGQVKAGQNNVDQLDSEKRHDHAANPVNDQVPPEKSLGRFGLVLHALQRERHQRNDNERVEND